MKIYTKTGDQGKSSLLSGERVAKNDARIKAYGEVDELNSVIGAVASVLPGGTEPLSEQLQTVQSDLFSVGAWLATTPGAPVADQLVPVDDAAVMRLEAYIDALDALLPELRAFILPGGHPAAAQAHIARTVCRRAERHAIDLLDSATAGERDAQMNLLAPILAYLNRLSDYLFVAARYCNHAAGVPDTVWRQPS